MITEFFLNIIFACVSGMLEILPDLEWSVETSAFEYFLDTVRVASYMLPMDTVVAIIALIVDLTIIRIVIAIPKAIWDLLPLV